MKKTPYERKTISINDYEEVNDPGTLDTRGCCDCNSQRITCASEDRTMQYEVKGNGLFFSRIFSDSFTNPKASQ